MEPADFLEILDGEGQLPAAAAAAAGAAASVPTCPEWRVRVRAVGAGEEADAVWTVRLTAEPPVTVRGEEGPAEAELPGPADQLYLALWNRTAVPRVTGDPSLAALWRERSGS
ncbi:hypothetical protein [Streptomyces tricolor]|uniref:hypothetical protein n=1 Tax=Streptomyces tricolor TaxID=68277 RepID=UPI0036EEF629